MFACKENNEGVAVVKLKSSGSVKVACRVVPIEMSVKFNELKQGREKKGLK